MKRQKLVLAVVFIFLGLLDLTYGMIRGDRVSIIVGSLMAVIALIVAFKESRAR